MTTLYLASASTARKKLLEEAGIEFEIVPHCSNEAVGAGLTIEKRVLAVAHDKMACVDLSSVPSTKFAFVLTADTMLSLRQGTTELVLGKPKDRDDARRMIALMRKQEVKVVTGCCLERRYFVGETWKTEQQAEWTTSATCTYHLPESMVDEYFRHVPTALHACGGCTVEGYGLQFLKHIVGSYSTVLGLPMAELREQLHLMKF